MGTINQPTIFALSTGMPPSGVAIIRVSGPLAFTSLDLFHVKHPAPRTAQLSELRDSDGRTIDQALILTFPAPNSFTGEDLVEYHCHGGQAVVSAILAKLSELQSARPADRGEFTLRAYQNGKIDLSEAEALADLIGAQTENQRRLAIQHFDGKFGAQIQIWRQKLIALRASVEADFDFADEEDVPGSVADQISDQASVLANDIQNVLNDQHQGEIIRTGLRVVISGPPNAGKSSLLNALAQRDVAIVTDIPGTTRDVLSVSLDLNGQLVIISDTAGLRPTQDVIERAGIQRARMALDSAHLVLWLVPVDMDAGLHPIPDTDRPVWIIQSKSDLQRNSEIDAMDVDQNLFDARFSLSSKTGFGVAQLMDAIGRFGSGSISGQSGKGPDSDHLLVARLRHRDALQICVDALRMAGNDTEALEIRVEFIRQASDALGRILGRIDVEDVLGHIFSEFCIGK